MNIFTLLLTQPLANGLVLFYKVLGENMGLAIIGFSLLLRVILTPLTKPYLESMKKMREVAPQLEKLKQKHKGDKTKLMKAQADFYKEKGINPSAGCLPQILQIIVLIALYNVFTKALVDGGIVTNNFNSLLYAPLKFIEGAKINTQFLYLNISKPDVINVGLPFSLPGPILILAALSQMISAKIAAPYLELEEKMAAKTPKKEDDFQVAMQNSAIYTFPLMTILIGVRFPSGLALYWLLFSLFQTLQQYRSTGLGGLTPWLKRLNLLKLPHNDKKSRKSKNN
ncbi:MAG: membrane protein insertase YidC [Candidatus Woesebacteria bacterium]|nr:MAG: membrane protein insertase YidC [Candidatus Woesebacteria bacterium]